MRILVPILCGVATSLVAFMVLLLTSGSPDANTLALQSVLAGIFAALYAYFKSRRSDTSAANLATEKVPSAATPRTPTHEEKPEPKSRPHKPYKPVTDAELDEYAKRLEAKGVNIHKKYYNFGELHRDLVFPNQLPLAEAQPLDLPEGRRLCENQGLPLMWHRWVDGRFSFTLDGTLLPVAVYRRERVTISRTKETESYEGYSWSASVPSLGELLKENTVDFNTESDGKMTGKLFQDRVVHSTGLTTYLYLTLDSTRGSLEIQYYHDFDGE